MDSSSSYKLRSVSEVIFVGVFNEMFSSESRPICVIGHFSVSLKNIFV